MFTSRWLKMLPLAMLIAGLAGSVAGCSGDDDGDSKPKGTGGSDVGTGGSGGTGGEEPGTGGSGGVAPTPCKSHSDCDEGERCDETDEVCVPKCRYDMDCGRDTGTRCEQETGLCVAAEPCQFDYNCGYQDDYCGKDECVCIPDSSIGDGETGPTGVCWRKSKICQPCDGDHICGAPGASCNFFQVGPDKTEAVCLPNGNCNRHPGTVPADESYGKDLAGKCIPQFGDCQNFSPCESDADCPTGRPVCDLTRQVCIPGCTFDFDTKSSVGCASDKTCHYTKAGMDKNLLRTCETADAFGAGKCEPPCTDDSECRAKDCQPGEKDCITENWICRQDGAQRRCGPPGCVSDDECVQEDSEYRGYCNIDSGQCVFDQCRVGVDKRRGCVDQPYPDCAGSHKCVGATEDAVVGTCEPKDCADKGGADLACGVGEFCKGEPFRDPDSYKAIDKKLPYQPSDSEAPFPGCYPLNETAFCGTCKDHADCGKGALIPYKGYKAYGHSPNICNDWLGLGASCGFGCEYDAECPGSWQCTSQNLEKGCSGNDFEQAFQTCNKDSDCAGGSKCVEPLVNGYAPSDDVVKFKVCQCDPNAQGACGKGFACNAGLGTMSRSETDAKYLKVQANYCVKQEACGKGGSCEWFGDAFTVIPDQPKRPFLICATNAGLSSVNAKCPDGTRGGLRQWDKYRCVFSQVCQPPAIQNSDGDFFCGLRD